MILKFIFDISNLKLNLSVFQRKLLEPEEETEEEKQFRAIYKKISGDVSTQ